MFENPRRGRQARNFTTNVSKILDLKSPSEQIFFRKLSLGAPVGTVQGFQDGYTVAFNSPSSLASFGETIFVCDTSNRAVRSLDEAR